MEQVAQQRFDPRIAPLPKSSKGWFLEGLLTPVFGITLLLKQKGLIWYFIIPVIIQTVVSIALLSLIYVVGEYVIEWLDLLIEWVVGETSKIADIDQESTTESVSFFTTLAVRIFMGFVFFFIFLFCWRLTGGILTGYFGGLLTDKAIQSAGLKFDKRKETSFAGEIANGVFQAGALLLPQTLFGTLALIPIIGTLAAGLTGSVYACFLTGYGELRDPLEKMGHSRIKALKICGQNSAATTGLGLVKMTSEPIPILGGIVQASESLGRISLAIRIVRAAESENSAQKDPA